MSPAISAQGRGGESGCRREDARRWQSLGKMSLPGERPRIKAAATDTCSSEREATAPHRMEKQTLARGPQTAFPFLTAMRWARLAKERAVASHSGHKSPSLLLLADIPNKPL